MSDTPKAGLTWGMKQSFREYLEGISDLRIEAEGVTSGDAGYFFPLADSTDLTGLAFRGGLTIRAHRGMLRVILRAPAIEALDSSPVLTADVGEVVSRGKTVLYQVDLKRPDIQEIGQLQ